VRLNKIILLVKTNEIYFLFLRQFEDAFENIGSLFKIKALKMVCYICNYILIFRFCKYTNDYILFKKEEPILFKDDQSAIKRNLVNIDKKLSFKELRKIAEYLKTVDRDFSILLEDKDRTFNINMHRFMCFALTKEEAILKMETIRPEFKGRKIEKITSMGWNHRQKTEYIDPEFKASIDRAKKYILEKSL